jgi:hypothetical protein
VQAGEVSGLHLDTKSTYTVMNKMGAPIFTCKLADTVPCVPEGYNFMPNTKRGDYVRVDATTVEGVQGSQRDFRFRSSDHHLLALGWAEFEDNMGVNDLLDEDFLLYYQRIDSKTAACPIKTPARNTTKGTSTDAAEAESADELPAKKKVKKWQTLKNQTPASAKRGRGNR